jgi:hypothetical protein
MRESPTERNARIFHGATAAGEPVFVIRAKDDVALQAIGAYMAYAIAHGVDLAFIEACDALVADFEQWRREHPDLCKTPDI